MVFCYRDRQREIRYKAEVYFLWWLKQPDLSIKFLTKPSNFSKSFN